MPGMYAADDYDLAGFSVGAVERGRQLDGTAVAEGDVVLALASSGLHSNGFSLVRRVVADLGINYRAPAPFQSEVSLAEALLVPTRIYVRPLLAAIAAGGVHALAHITGGGLPENLPRVLPAELAAELDPACWRRAPVFDWLAEAGAVPEADLYRTFNCGVGMVVVAGAGEAEAVAALLAEAGETVTRIGRVVPRAGQPAVRFRAGAAG
jgi:phosphoribosylformylglycinamidine cyclo-ligase